MNAARSAQLEEIFERLSSVQGQLGNLESELEGVIADEEGEFDNLPEEAQIFTQGQSIERSARNLNTARRILEASARDLSRALDSINAAHKKEN